MTTYLFQGLVHPERAQITLQCSFPFTHLTTSRDGTARISILLNQVAVWVDTDVVWDVHDLRNVVKTMVSHELEVVVFIKGLAYEVEIRRVLNPEHGVDYVFGVEIPCIAERNKDVDLLARVNEIRGKTGHHRRRETRTRTDFVHVARHIRTHDRGLDVRARRRDFRFLAIAVQRDRILPTRSGPHHIVSG